MYFEHDGIRWFIQRKPSCFVARKGKDDVSIFKHGSWGRRDIDGKLYKCCMRIQAEDGEILRNYEAVPEYITIEWLQQSGFVDLKT